jgi:hypothetical protein
MRIFNKSIILSLLALSLACMTSCEAGEKKLLNVSPLEIVFEKEGGTASINITTNSAQWNITSEAAWLQISQTTGLSPLGGHYNRKPLPRFQRGSRFILSLRGVSFASLR